MRECRTLAVVDDVLGMVMVVMVVVVVMVMMIVIMVIMMVVVVSPGAVRMRTCNVTVAVPMSMRRTIGMGVLVGVRVLMRMSCARLLDARLARAAAANGTHQSTSRSLILISSPHVTCS